jgi:Flp pilus assembly protein TadG
MKHPLRKSISENSGATAVELALTMPLFLALLMGVIQIGLALWTQFGIQYGSEAAARCASVDAASCGTSDQIATYAAGHALGLSLPKSAFSVSIPSCGNQVSASFVYRFNTLLLGTPSVTLSARSCFPASPS